MKTQTKIKTILFSILALIFGIILSAGTYAIAFTPASDQLYRIASGDLSIHFMQLGNAYAGDSIYIKANDNDILIDAGSRTSSYSTISSYMKNYMGDDKTIEYVIATHAHQDHIAAFPKIFENYEVKNVIDFGTATKFERNGASETKTYRDYKTARDNEGANYAPVSNYNEPDFLSNIDNANPETKSIDLGSGITLTILNNYFYTEPTKDENNYSVCVLISQGTNHILLTGDLEKEGEIKLIQLNNLPKCVLFKAGHHGSKTSNQPELLEVIQPENVVFTCVAGSTEYTDIKDNTFPTQIAINNISKYTKSCYVTSLYDASAEKEFTSMNGDIIFMSNKTETKIVCNNNYTLLKDTNWFKQNRVWLGVA